MESKKWTKPSITIIVKSSSKEAVLAQCKNDINGPIVNQGGCRAGNNACKKSGGS